MDQNTLMMDQQQQGQEHIQQQGPPPQNLESITENITERYLSQYSVTYHPPLRVSRDEILLYLQAAESMENRNRDKGEKIPITQKLPHNVIAEVILHFYNVRCIEMTDSSDSDGTGSIVGIYVDNPLDTSYGTYATDERRFWNIAAELSPSMRTRDFKEIMVYLKNHAPRVERCKAPDLIPLCNGILDYRTKTLYPFDPDYVFMSKVRTNWNPQAQNVIITDPVTGDVIWDCEEWLLDLMDNDLEMRDVILQVIGATLRPYVSWNQCVIMYNQAGNAGKGTLCRMLRSILGPGATAAIQLSEMSQDFLLTQLISAQAVIADENDVHAYIDQSAKLKALTTGDPIQVNRKFKDPVNMNWRGLIVQCFNSRPNFKDRSDSLFRRFLLIPFSRCFTGAERHEIKDDYIRRNETMEYLVFRALTLPDYYEFSEPAPCKAAKDELKEAIDPVRAFAAEILPLCAWDLLPFPFLYDLFMAYYTKTHGGGQTRISRQTFIDDLLEAIKGNDEWECKDRRARVASANRMSWPEPLIAEYNLTDWMSKTYHGSDPDKVSVTNPLKPLYSGLVRKTPTAGKMVN